MGPVGTQVLMPALHCQCLHVPSLHLFFVRGVVHVCVFVCVWGGGGCIEREGASEAAPQAVRQAVGGGCQSGWGRLLSVTNAIEAGTWRQGDSGCA